MQIDANPQGQQRAEDADRMQDQAVFQHGHGQAFDVVGRDEIAPLQGRGGPVRQPRFGTLTKREREILKMLAEGQSVKEIASSFELSVKTVEAHKFNLMRKLDIHNKAHLVQYAIQKKIIRLPELVMT